MELKKHVVENMVDLLREMLTSARTPYEMKTPIKMVVSEYDLLPKGSEVCEAEGLVAELRDQLKVVNREWEKANIEILKLARDISSLNAYSIAKDAKIRLISGRLDAADEVIRQLEEEESQHNIAYRAMLDSNGELLRENAILRKKLGCKSCPPGEECYCKPIGGYEK